MLLLFGLLNLGPSGGGGAQPIDITVQPVSDTVLLGQQAVFAVAATGTSITYQWYKNGVAIGGATSSSYTTPPTVLTDSGSTFECVLTNSLGSVATAPAVLTVAQQGPAFSTFVWDGQLPGLTMNNTRGYVWNTNVQGAISGKESRVGLMQYPRVAFELQYELLRDNLAVSELKTVMGIFNAAGGMMRSFLFNDSNFNSVAFENFGVGDGSTAGFQLSAIYANAGAVGEAELVQNLAAAPSVYVNGLPVVLGTDYTLSPTGVVNFAVAPGQGAVLQWSGSFYYRVRFDQDQMIMTQFLKNWWNSAKIKLISVKL